MGKVLVITGILPVPLIEHKKRENDILLVTEDEIVARYPDISFRYIFVFPYAPWIFSKVSSKWKSYFNLGKLSNFSLRGRDLILLPTLLLPKRVFFRNLLVKISLFLFRNRIDILIREFEPTILHAQNADIDAIIAKEISKRYNIPYIITLRSLEKVEDKIIVDNLKYAESLVGISLRQKKVGEQIGHKPVNFIPHGVNENFYKYRKFKKSEKLKIRFVTVSRLLKLKNIDLVISCLKNFPHDFVFDIYGEGPEMKSLQDLINELELENNIHLKGFIDNNELPTVLPEYDLFIMPSYPETLGRVYFEAMASGVPIVASKNTGVDGIITDGLEGFLIDHTSRDELNNILNLLAKDQTILLKMSLHAKKLSENFNWVNISLRYRELYQNNT